MHCYFAVSKVCNLRCQYCYVPEYNKSHQVNYDSQAVTAARRFSKKIRQESFSFESITLHGAEPSILSARALGEVIQIFWEATGNQVQIQSNGTRLTEPYLNKLIEVIGNPNRIFVGISIDGSASIHNPQRNDTWHKVTENIKTLRKHGFEVGLLSVITPLTIKHLQDFDLWVESVKHIVQGLTFKLGEHGFGLSEKEGIFANWVEDSFEEIRTKRKSVYRSRPVDPECETCPYDSLCHSGCPLSRENNKSVDCRIKKNIYPKLLRDGIKAEAFFAVETQSTLLAMKRARYEDLPLIEARVVIHPF